MNEENKEKTAWTATPFELGDLPDIGLFFKKHYTGSGEYGSMDLFYWKIVRNCVKQGIINMVKDGDKIASTTSVTPKRLFLNGSEHIAAEIGDTYTDPAYQRQGMFALLINKSTKNAVDSGIDFIYGTPNNQSLPGYEKKANYKVIPDIDVRSLIIPVNIETLVQKRSHWLIGRYANAVYSSMLYCYFSVKKLLYRSSSDLKIDEVVSIPDGWNEFWQEARTVCDFILSRDRDAVNWRFIENPNKYRIYVLKRKERIVGYIVYRIVHDILASRLVISDFLFLPGEENNIKMLLFKVLEDACCAGATLVYTWCPRSNLYFKILKRFGFIERNNIPVICFQNDFAKAIQTSCQRWHFTISDSDNI